MAVEIQPQREVINQAEFDTLRAKAFAAWSRGPTATYQAWFDDAFQEGWIRLEKALASGREIQNWQGYIIESGRNYLHRLHGKGARTTELRDDDATLVDAGAAERFEAVEDHAERLHQAKIVRQVLAEEFDERERQLIKLKYELQRDDREIAAVMNVSPRAVKRCFSGKREKGQLGINQRLAQYIGPAPDEALLCRSRRSQVKALVGGWAMSSARKAQVQAHLETCEGCRKFTRHALGYQMLLPPVALPVTLAADSSSADTLTQMAQVLHHTVDKVDSGPASGIAAAVGGSGSAAVAAQGGVEERLPPAARAARQRQRAGHPFSPAGEWPPSSRSAARSRAAAARCVWGPTTRSRTATESKIRRQRSAARSASRSRRRRRQLRPRCHPSSQSRRPRRPRPAALASARLEQVPAPPPPPPPPAEQEFGVEPRPAARPRAAPAPAPAASGGENFGIE